MASYTSCRWTGTSLGATIPSRTLSPRISTTVTVMSLLMMILSFFFLDSTSIAVYPSQVSGGQLRLLDGAPTCLFGGDFPLDTPAKIRFPCNDPQEVFAGDVLP